MLKQSLKMLAARRDLYQAKLVFYLFIASLGMFFAGSLVTFCVIRSQSFRPIIAGAELDQGSAVVQSDQGAATGDDQSNSNVGDPDPIPLASFLEPGTGNELYDDASLTNASLVYQELVLPSTFWISTAFLILVSVFLQRAVWLVHRERQLEFRNWLLWAWAAAILFVFVQAFGLHNLFETHFSKSDGSTKVFGMTFAISFIHALHVLGGIGFLGFVIFQAFRNRYDHERHWAVDHCAGYWHFLDVVWLCMILTFVIAR